MNRTLERKRKKRILTIRKIRQRLWDQEDERKFANREWERWLVWKGISPESNRSVSQIGIYTDFT